MDEKMTTPNQSPKLVASDFAKNALKMAETFDAFDWEYMPKMNEVAPLLRALADQYTAQPAQCVPDAAMVERLQHAIEGECDGLAINEAHARAVLEYVLAATPAPAPAVPEKLPSGMATSQADGKWRVTLEFDSHGDADALKEYMLRNGVPSKSMAPAPAQAKETFWVIEHFRPDGGSYGRYTWLGGRRSTADINIADKYDSREDAQQAIARNPQWFGGGGVHMPSEHAFMAAQEPEPVTLTDEDIDNLARKHAGDPSCSGAWGSTYEFEPSELRAFVNDIAALREKQRGV